MADSQSNSRFKGSQKHSAKAGFSKTFSLTENQRITAMLAAELDMHPTSHQKTKGPTQNMEAYLESKVTRIAPNANPVGFSQNPLHYSSLKGSPTKAFSIRKTIGQNMTQSFTVSV